MKDEMVDILDRRGEILYTTSKKEAHEKGLLHCCVIAEIINSKDEWLLIIPKDHKQDAGQYVSPVGGYVSAGEKTVISLKRETKEEIGIDVKNYKKIGEGIFDRKILGRHENHLFILFEIKTDQEPRLGDEGKAYKWFSQMEIKDKVKSNPKMFGEAFHFIFKYIYNGFKEV